MPRIEVESDGSLECSLAFGMVAAAAHGRAASTRCRKVKAWQTCGTWMTATSCVIRYWCRLPCRNSMSPTEQNPQKTEVIALRGRSGCTTSRVENPRRAEYGQSHHSHRGLHNTWSGCRTETAHSGSALGQGGCGSSYARTRSAVPGPADKICSPTGKSWRAAASTTSCECTATRSCRRNGLPKSSTRSGSVLSSVSALASRKTV